MDRQFLIGQVYWLRREGKSIRAIATKLGVHPSTVQRALRSLDQVGELELPLESPTQAQKGSFVGRRHELGQLISALENAIGGQGQVAMLTGEPGIGKTRTIQELAALARQHRVPVLWGRCYEEPGAPPYWPWMQIIRHCIKECRPGQLRSLMGVGASNIAEIIPEVSEALPNLEPPPRVEPEQARFRLFDSLTSYLNNVSRAYPLVIVLDNLHWADRPSLMLLEFLVQELGQSRLLIIGTYRDAELSRRHSLSQTLGELTKYSYFHRILLYGLEPEDIHDLIRQTAEVTPSQTLTESIQQRTLGNPLFITELVKMLAQEGKLSKEVSDGDVKPEWGIPEGVREAIDGRLLEQGRLEVQRGYVLIPVLSI